MHMLRQGQTKRVKGRDALGRARFVQSLFEAGAKRVAAEPFLASRQGLQHYRTGTGAPPIYLKRWI